VPCPRTPAVSVFALRYTLLARSRPETALFPNFVVRHRVSLCDVPPTLALSGPPAFGVTARGAVRDVPKYDTAETLAFLELIKKLLVSASGTAQPPTGLSGWELAHQPLQQGSCR
jgi:hypothetical protein